MGIERQVISGLKWTGATKLVTQVVNWIITLVVVRLLAPQDYGLMATAAAIVGVVGVAAEFGLGSSVVQAAELADDEIARVAGVALVLNLFAALVVVACAPLAAWALREPRVSAVIQVAVLQFGFAAIGAVPQALLTRRLEFKTLGAIEVASGILTNLTTLVLAWRGAGVWALVLGVQLGALVRTVLLLRRGWIRPRFEFTGMARHVSFGGRLAAARVIWQFASQIDVLIASRLLGSSAVGVYSVALNVAMLPMQKVMSIVNQVAFPAVARLQDDAERLSGHLLKAIKALAVIGVPLSWGLAAVAPEFIPLAFGDKWMEVVVPMQVMSVTIPLRMVGAMLVTASAAKGSAGTEVRNTVVTLLVLPPAFWIGAHWGVLGLAWAWPIGVAICYTIIMPRVGKVLQLGLRPVIVAALPAILAGLAMCAAIMGTRWAVGLSSRGWELAVLILAGAISYPLALWVADRSIFADLRGWLRNR